MNLECFTLRLLRLRQAESTPCVEPDRLCFVFPKGGAGKYSCGNFSQRLSAGDVFVFCGAPGGTFASERGEMVFWCFWVTLEHLLPLFLGSEIPLLRNVAENFRATRLYPASTPLASECHRLLSDMPVQFDLNHRGQLLKVAAAILAEELKNPQQQRSGFVTAEAHLIQVFEKLTTDELMNLSVGDLARKFACSRRHLNRLFHSHFGFSVAALRMEMRLLKAITLLREPDAKIINVAEHCGFNHLGLFNTCFKRRFGMSPGKWRTKAESNGQGDSVPMLSFGLTAHKGHGPVGAERIQIKSSAQIHSGPLPAPDLKAPPSVSVNHHPRRFPKKDAVNLDI